MWQKEERKQVEKSWQRDDLYEKFIIGEKIYRATDFVNTIY